MPGPRLLVRAGPDAGEMEAVLARAVVQVVDRERCLGRAPYLRHEEQWQRLGMQGFLQRTDQQFSLGNAGYGTFDEFLGSLASRKRKAVSKGA